MAEEGAGTPPAKQTGNPAPSPTREDRDVAIRRPHFCQTNPFPPWEGPGLEAIHRPVVHPPVVARWGPERTGWINACSFWKLPLARTFRKGVEAGGVRGCNFVDGMGPPSLSVGSHGERRSTGEAESHDSDYYPREPQGKPAGPLSNPEDENAVYFRNFHLP
jgi:hypothetical protein